MEELFIKIIAQGLAEKFKSGDYPNIPFPTLKGHVMWDTVVSSGGWKLQRFTVTGHYRVLDPNDVRRAWGTREKMKEIMEDIAR